MNNIAYVEPQVRMTEVRECLGLTARAVRFYEECGLIRPARDRLGRRVFDSRSRLRLELIGKLRRAGLGMEAVTALMAQQTASAWRGQALAALSQRRSELDAQLEALGKLEEWVASLGEGAPPWVG